MTAPRRGSSSRALSLLVATAVAAVLVAGVAAAETLKIDSLPGDLKHIDWLKFRNNLESNVDHAVDREPLNGKIVDPITLGSGNSNCYHGWTGNDCEFPICHHHHDHEHGPANPENTLVDIFFVRPPVNAFTIYVDNTILSFTLNVHVQNGTNPHLYLYDRNNTLILPTTEEQQSHSETTFGYRDVRPGTYSAVVSSDVPSASYITFYYAETFLFVEMGGILVREYHNGESLHDDFPALNTLYAHRVNDLVASPINLEFPGTLSTVSLMSEQEPAVFNMRLDLRYGCHFAYYLRNYFCIAEGHYIARFRGYDFFGHSFTRIVSYRCEIYIAPPSNNTTPSPVSPTPTGPLHCNHHGLLITNADNSQYCYCDDLYGGADCSIALCLNGGSQFEGQQCLCPNGFSGSHCQDVQCVDNEQTPYLEAPPSLNFVIRTRSQLGSVIAQVAEAVQQVINALDTVDPDYTSRFSIVSFNNNQSSYNSYRTGNQVVHALYQLANTTDNTGGCNDQLFGPLIRSLTGEFVTSNSPIYVITDALPHDHNDGILGVVEGAYSRDRAQINFIVVEPADTTCPPIEFGDLEVGFLALTSQRTSGITTVVRRSQQNTVGSLLYAHIATTYHNSHLVFADDQRSCHNIPRYIPVAVDNRFAQIAVVVEGVNASVQINAPDGSVVQPYSQTYGVVTIAAVSAFSGSWTVTVISQSIQTPCSVRVYAIEEFRGETSDYALHYGITYGLVENAPFFQPLAGVPVSITARLENFEVRRPERLNAEIIVYQRGDRADQGRSFVMASNGIWRTHCNYQLYFPPLTCYDERNTLYFTIFVTDNHGFAVQRAGTFFCATIHPPPPPQNGTCANGGIYFNNTCYCQPGFTGSQCIQTVCFNNGTLNPFGFCDCPIGTGGQHCELLRCITPNPVASFSLHMRHHTFVLDVTKNNVPVLQNAVQIISDTIRDLGRHGDNWITRYWVVAADSQQVYNLGDTHGTNPFHVVDFFNRALQIAQNSSDSSCTARIFQALTHNLHNHNHNSYFTVVTSASPDTTDLASTVIPAYAGIIEGEHILNVFAAKTGPNTYNCPTANIQAFNTLADLTELSNGRLIGLTTPSLAFKLLPTLYSSSTVYNIRSADCSNGLTLVTPVDAYAQSMQVYVNGLPRTGSSVTNSLTILRPNLHNAQNVTTALITDSNVGFGLFDVRRACDEDWQSGGNNLAVPYCFHTSLNLFNWTTAARVCQIGGGQLADDLSDSMNVFLNDIMNGHNGTWIGLHSINGSWEWDNGPFRPPTPYNITSYNRFANGDSSVDPSKPCVYLGTDTYWHKDNCSTPRYYTCQKYKYTADFEPNHIDSDDIPAGRWQVSYTGSGACQVEIKVQSSLRLYAGFVDHRHSDFPQPEGHSHGNNRLVAHVIGVVAPDQFPFLRYANLRNAANNSLVSAATYEYRLGCTYEYVSQNFTCPSNDPTARFEVLHIGEDERGLPFQRVTTNLCATPRGGCENGLLYNGQCICDDYFTGPECAQPICQNGGTLNSNQCHCVSGFAGPACQFETCINRVDHNHTFSDNGKTLVIVIETTTNNQAALTGLQNSLQSTLQSLNARWFSTYTFVTFDTTGVRAVQSTTTISSAVDLFNTLTANPSTTNSCQLPLVDSLAATANLTLPANSIVLLIAAAAPADHHLLGEFFTGIANSESQLHFINVLTSVCPNNTITEPSIAHLGELAVATDGNYLPITTNGIATILPNYLPALHNETVAGTPSIRQGTFTCPQLILNIPIDNRTHSAYIYTYGAYGIPSVTSTPNGGGAALNFVYGDGNYYIFHFHPQQQGYYTITLNNPGSCYLQVRLQGGAELFVGYTPIGTLISEMAQHLDQAQPVPNYGQNLLVAHTRHERVRLDYAVIEEAHRGVGEVQIVKLHERFNCSYRFFSDVFTCDQRGYHVTIFGTSEGGTWLSRQFYTVCKNYTSSTTGAPLTTQSGLTTLPVQTTTAGQTTQPGQTTQTVPTQTTQSGQTTQPTQATTTSSNLNQGPADVVLLLDGSTALTLLQQNQTAFFAQNLFNGFSLGSSTVNIAIVLVGGDNSLVFPTSTYNAIDSTTGLVGQVVNSYNIYQNLGTYSSGQTLLSSALNTIATSQDFNNAYRTSITNHLVIYLTSSSSPDTAAINAANTLRSSAQFKYSTVAVSLTTGSSANAGPLAQFAGNSNCVYQTTDYNTYIGQFAQTLAGKIQAASTSGAAYC